MWFSNIFPSLFGARGFLFIPLHPSPTLVSHKPHDLAGVAVLVVGDEQALELRDVFFGNHKKPGGFADQVVIGEDDRRALVAVVENLRFHAVKAQPDCGFDRLRLFRDDSGDFFFHVNLNGKRRQSETPS